MMDSCQTFILMALLAIIITFIIVGHRGMPWN